MIVGWDIRGTNCTTIWSANQTLVNNENMKNAAVVFLWMGLEHANSLALVLICLVTCCLYSVH